MTIKEIEKALRKEITYIKGGYLVIETVSIDCEDGYYITIKGRYGREDAPKTCRHFEIWYKNGESLDYIRGYFSRIVEENENDGSN